MRLDDIPMSVSQRKYMTHNAPGPDPGADRARQYIEDFKAFAKGGLTGVAKARGAKLPEWSNTVGEAAHNEIVNDAAKLAARRALWAEPIGHALQSLASPKATNGR
jgi:hypothetical protein